MFVLNFAVISHPMSLYAPVARSPGSRAARGRRKAGCPWDNPVCLWQTELFKFYLKSSPSPSGHNRRRRLATDSRQSKRGFGTAVPKTTIEVADHCSLRVCTGQPAFADQTGEPWHPSCHGGKTPANLQVPLRPCAPAARSPGSRGSAPCARPSAERRPFPANQHFADQTGEPWHPSCHGGKTPANLQVFYAPARQSRAVTGAGL